jgi:phospholipase A1
LAVLLRATALCAALWIGSGPTRAQGRESCTPIDDDRERLACYDRAAGRAPRTDVPAVGADVPIPEDKPTKAGDFVGGGNNVATGGSRLGFKWELDDDTRFGVLRFRTHKPNYFLPASYSGDPNETPVSPSLGAAPTTDLRELEAKFQLSLKTKVIEGAMNDRVDVWFAYTQQSHWQLYSPSAPFRETDYEPEVMTVVRTDWEVRGLRLRFVNVGFVHQSNGKGGAQSRSWNRIYAQFAFERGGFALLVRPCYRTHDAMAGGVPDNNPDIVDYLGHGDLLLSYHPDGSGHSFAALMRQNFRTGHGAIQLDWRFPLYRNLKGYLQLFNGYGDSLIDYNHRQSVFGIGLSLSDWM